MAKVTETLVFYFLFVVKQPSGVSVMEIKIYGPVIITGQINTNDTERQLCVYVEQDLLSPLNECPLKVVLIQRPNMHVEHYKNQL